MDSKSVPAELPIALEGACTFALECWRLNRMAVLLKDRAEGAGLRYAVGRIGETLDVMGIQIVDFAGRAYDPGMVPEVVEIREGAGLPDDSHAAVEETIAPTIIWRGQVIKNGQIIVKGRRGTSSEFTEARE